MDEIFDEAREIASLLAELENRFSALQHRMRQVAVLKTALTARTN
jgi:hypothetical protein